MNPATVIELADRVNRLLAEAEAIEQTAADFPALRQNAVRIKAAARMMAAAVDLPPDEN